jgi:hypothetical protein
MSAEYKKLHESYRNLAAKAKAGDKDAHAAKAVVMNEIRQAERESARAGKVISAQYQADSVVISTEETSSKRSLQEEYIRKFDDERPVTINGQEQTLRQFHRRRLLGR